MQNLLDIKNLEIRIKLDNGYRELIKGLDLTVNALDIVALVGSSGSGKTTVGLSILGLLPSAMTITNGKIFYLGDNILDFSPERTRQLRGGDISMIFQEPLSAFNPVFTLGFQIEEVLKVHTPLAARQRKEKVLDLLHIVGVDDPKRIARQYPHQLSGGLRQRAMIAQAIAANPRLIIADEPTSSLDVTLQALVMDVFRKLKNELKISMLLITHDLGVVRELADEVVVLYDGHVVERGKTKEVLADPHHSFTSELAETLKV